MIKVHLTRHLDSSADESWARVGDFHGLASWHPAVAETVASEGGEVRALHTQDGAVILERRTGTGERSYSYKILEGPLPVRDYNSTLSVTEDDNGGSEVVWDAEFEAEGAPEDVSRGVVEGILNAGLEAL